MAWRNILWSISLAGALGGSAFALDINQANEAELDSVKGLGPSSTARILKARENGPFTDWDDLMRRVKGIKPALASRLSADGLTVQSQGYGNPAAKVAP